VTAEVEDTVDAKTDVDHFSNLQFVVRDWIFLMHEITEGEDEEGLERIAHAEASEKWLAQRKSDWETRIAVTPERSAAEILAGMLNAWQTPGAIWYRPAIKRYRLCGADYKPSAGEFCMGVFAPGTTPEALEAEMQALDDEAPELPTKPYAEPIQTTPQPAPEPEPVPAASDAPPRPRLRMADLKPSVIHYCEGG